MINLFRKKSLFFSDLNNNRLTGKDYRHTQKYGINLA